jgi:hypothetical protein
MLTNQKPVNSAIQMIIGTSLGLLLLILSIQVLFPVVKIPFFGILPGALSMVDFVIHEAGHLIFSFLGQFIGVMGGTLAQLFFPTVCLLLSLRRRQWVSVSVFLFWLGQSLVQISKYVGDAQTQSLKLFSPGSLFGGPEPIHDWHFLLDKTGLLWADHMLSGMVFLCGLVFLLGSAGLLFAWGVGWKRLVTI